MDSTVTLTDTTASYGANMYFVNGQWQPTITVGLGRNCPPRHRTLVLLSQMASDDVASNICQALSRQVIDTHFNPSFC